MHDAVAHDATLDGAGGGQDERPLRPDRLGQADRAGHRADAAVEPQLAEERPVADGLLGDDAAGDEEGHRDREVEPGADLAHGGWRQVDRDPSVGPVLPAREERGAHAVARLAAGGVGQTDDGEGRESAAEVDLDGDGVAVDAEQRRGGDEAEHGTLLGGAPWWGAGPEAEACRSGLEACGRD